MNLEKFISSLPNDELIKLRALIDKKLGHTDKAVIETPTEDLENEARMVYESIQKSISLRGGRHIPWSVFQTSQDSRTLVRRTPWLVSFINKHLKPKTRVELIWCVDLIVKQTVLFLERNSIPVSTRTVVSNLDRAPSLLDAAFPGYLKANILTSLLEQLR